MFDRIVEPTIQAGVDCLRAESLGLGRVWEPSPFAFLPYGFSPQLAGQVCTKTARSEEARVLFDGQLIRLPKSGGDLEQELVYANVRR